MKSGRLRVHVFPYTNVKTDLKRVERRACYILTKYSYLAFKGQKPEQKWYKTLRVESKYLPINEMPKLA